MSVLSDEQQTIVDALLEPMSVIACAGSGKTRTAVYRVVEMRDRKTERLVFNQRAQVFTLFFSELLGVVEQLVSEIIGKNHGCCGYRSGKTTSSGFVGAGLELESGKLPD